MTPGLAEAVAALTRGGLVAFPTETVYGLGADAHDADAVARIFAAKRRPVGQPVTVHLGPAADPGRYGAWGPDAVRLADAFWPGPLTIIVPRNEGVLDVVTGGLPSVGLRVPSHPLCMAFLDAFGRGVAATSANRHGSMSPTTAEHVRADLGADVDVVLDGGPCPLGVESTVLVLGTEPRVLRRGGVSLGDLEDVLARPVAAAPGQAGYNLRTPVFVQSSLAADPGWRRVGVLAPARPSLEVDIEWIPAASDPAQYARSLFHSLRTLDEGGHDAILVQAVPSGGLWDAIRERLDRAARRQ